MIYFPDTGLNAPESKETLLLQQEQLIAGRRAVQMFPVGTTELQLPRGMERAVNERGAFHYNPELISWNKLFALSALGRENEFLLLGPYSKSDIYEKLLQGEHLRIIVETAPSGVEVRTAAGTDKTVKEQLEFFDRTKEWANTITVYETPPKQHRIAMRS